MSIPVARAADLLRTIGDETRLQILALLSRRELCVCELVDLFPISQPAVSGHLRRLRDAGLVEDDRRGVWVYYRACRTIPAIVQSVLRELVLPAELEAALERKSGECSDEEPGTAASGPPARGKRSPEHRQASRRPSDPRGAIHGPMHGRVPG